MNNLLMWSLYQAQTLLNTTRRHAILIMSILKEEIASQLSTAIVSWCDIWCPVLTMSEYDFVQERA